MRVKKNVLAPSTRSWRICSSRLESEYIDSFSFSFSCSSPFYRLSLDLDINFPVWFQIEGTLFTIPLADKLIIRKICLWNMNNIWFTKLLNHMGQFMSNQPHVVCCSWQIFFIIKLLFPTEYAMEFNSFADLESTFRFMYCDNGNIITKSWFHKFFREQIQRSSTITS